MATKSALEAAGKTFRTQNISKRVRQIVISPIKEMSILADEFAKKTRGDIVSFGQGIPYFDTPAYIKRALRKALGEKDTARYTLEPGIPALRVSIAKNLEKTKHISSVDPFKEIMVSTGCQEAVACALAATIDPGDEVLLPSPAFASYSEQVLQLGGVPVFAPLNEKAGWTFDAAACEKKITKKTKVVLFSHPSNPTGMLFDQSDLESIARIARKYNLIVISDETYDFLTYEGKEHISIASFETMRDRVILCGSFSKRYALTGYRVGYAFACEGILDHMLKVHDALTICAPALSQKAALAALEGPQDSVKEFAKKFTLNRNLVCEELDAMNTVFSYHPPMGAYYVFPKAKNLKIPSFDLALKLLYEARVIVIPGAAFGAGGEGHLRLSFCCRPEEIKEGFRRLRQWFRKNS